MVIAAALILIGGGQHHHGDHRVAVSRPVVLAPSAAITTPTVPATTVTSTTAAKSEKQANTARKRVAREDPQDQPGTKAAKRAARALKAHRALQHVPYRRGGVTIRLTGALTDGKAVLTVTAVTLHQARVGYRRFLARYHDSGRAYRPRFIASKGRRRG